jgi:outer membrane murein-binding lipoprotein Lpp
MKILNKTLLAGILFASALLSGCSDDEYTPGEASNASGINVFRIPRQRRSRFGPR